MGNHAVVVFARLAEDWRESAGKPPRRWSARQQAPALRSVNAIRFELITGIDLKD
jgi:hypothetical protein